MIPGVKFGCMNGMTTAEASKTKPLWNIDYLNHLFTHHQLLDSDGHWNVAAIAKRLGYPYNTVRDQLNRPHPSNLGVVWAFHKNLNANMNQLCR